MQITGDRSKTLYSQRYQQTYHSKHGAVNESLHVFVRGSTVANRLAQQRATRVLEIGFGLGLNFVLTADLALQHGCPLEYMGIEHMPISASQFMELDYKQWLQSAEPVTAVASVLRQCDRQHASNSGRQPVSDPRTDASTTAQNTHTVPLDNIGQLHLIVGDVVSPALQAQLAAHTPFDAIYLDAFSPDVNPECWTQPFLHTLNGLLAEDGVLATYCVKGAFQRNLIATGFSVTKAPGPAGKREILSATPNAAQNG